MLLYAQPVGTIVGLTTNGVQMVDDGTYLRLGRSHSCFCHHSTRS